MGTNYMGTETYGALLWRKENVTTEYLQLVVDYEAAKRTAEGHYAEVVVPELLRRIDAEWQEIKAIQVALEALEHVEGY